MSQNINKSTKKTQTKGNSAMGTKGDIDIIEIHSDSEDTVIEVQPKPSMKVTTKEGHNVQRDHFGQLKVGNPGVAISYFNIELNNFTNRKEADRLWWEQTDSWAARWDGTDSDDEGGTAWASVHLPKTHWKKCDALEKRKKLEEEALEEASKGPKTKKRKM